MQTRNNVAVDISISDGTGPQAARYIMQQVKRDGRAQAGWGRGDEAGRRRAGRCSWQDLGQDNVVSRSVTVILAISL